MNKNNTSATARPEKGQTQTQNLETSPYQAGFINNQNLNKMKKPWKTILLMAVLTVMLLLSARKTYAQCPVITFVNTDTTCSFYFQFKDGCGNVSPASPLVVPPGTSATPIYLYESDPIAPPCIYCYSALLV